jgi:hypothetical protein
LFSDSGAGRLDKPVRALEAIALGPRDNQVVDANVNAALRLDDVNVPIRFRAEHLDRRAARAEHGGQVASQSVRRPLKRLSSSGILNHRPSGSASIRPVSITTPMTRTAIARRPFSA